MQVWCHLGNLAFSLSIIFCASSKSSCFFYCAILVFSGGHPCLYSMPLWSHLGNLAISLSSNLGLIWGPPNVLSPCHLGAILAVLLCLWVAILVPAPSPLLSSFGPSWSSLEVPHVCTLCHCALTMAILLCFSLTLFVFSGGPQ